MLSEIQCVRVITKNIFQLIVGNEGLRTKNYPFRLETGQALFIDLYTFPACKVKFFKISLVKNQMSISGSVSLS